RVTERWDAVKLLAHQNQILEKRGKELRHTIEHLQAICESEEITRSKGRVHDLLGQRISLLLRALRDNQQPDETLLMDFIHNLPSMLREDRTLDPARRLVMLKETFQKMEVSVEIHGVLPENMEVADSFAEIAVECVTNAVRHGYATRIQFHFFQNECWRMTVTDNGIPPVGSIREGGGITEMRRRIRQLGGKMELYTVPRFSIQIFVPKEEVQR
ncbi:sensor histidine kinase, partial [Anaerotignum sp.]|uniref:sensor histidine kinase n=1 Tax=Anaerotignum sp. TaxID=2039241 RepID=UPI003735141E